MRNQRPQNQNKNQESYNSQVDPFEDSQSEQKIHDEKKKKKKAKKIKKNKKQKKHSKKKKVEEQNELQDYQFEDEEESQRNSMFDDQAQSGDQEEDEEFEAESGYEEEKQRYAELYNRPNATQRLLQKFEGKNERQINAQYSKKMNAIRRQQQLFPGELDPKLFVVNVKPKTEDRMVLSLLNKARHLHKTAKQLTIISAIALKKKFPGRIFVEAYSETDVRQALEGFINVYLGKKITKLQNQSYATLLVKPKEHKIEFQEKTFVRIKKGLYQGDLAKILKIKKRSIDVVVVPRINITDIKIKILNQTNKIQDEKAKQAKKQHIFKLLTDPKQKNYRQRPLKKQLSENDFGDLSDIKGVRNIKLATNNGVTSGLIIVNYVPEDLQKVQGTLLPAQVMPFTAEGKFIEQIKEDINNFATQVNFKRGQQVQIIAGQLQKCYGVLMNIRDKIGIIKCKNKDMKDQILQEPIVNLSKRFTVGQYVKVVTGAEIGKQGVLLTIRDKQVQIWTQNANAIWVNKKNVEASSAKSICTKNIHNLKKDDLIKTNKNVVGIVLETTKDNIKILDTSNLVQVISNMDFDQKIEIKNLVSKNNKGDEIKQGCIVFTVGAHQSKKCRVIHVYRQTAFIFNQSFRRNAGICAQHVDNLSIVAKNDTGRIQMSTKSNNAGNDLEQNQQIKVGMVYTIRQGPLKGYKGIVKSITNNKIEVRVLSKAITEWVQRKTLVSKPVDQNENIGRTPNRSVLGFQPSPFNNHSYQDD